MNSRASWGRGFPDAEMVPLLLIGPVSIGGVPSTKPLFPRSETMHLFRHVTGDEEERNQAHLVFQTLRLVNELLKLTSKGETCSSNRYP